MDEKIIKNINIMSRNLRQLRKLSGLSCEKLANKINISKQSISNLEVGSSKITMHWYILLRIIFEKEAKTNKVLKYILYILFESDSVIDDNLLATIESRLDILKDVRTSDKKTIERFFDQSIKPLIPISFLEKIDLVNINLPLWLESTIR